MSTQAQRHKIAQDIRQKAVAFLTANKYPIFTFLVTRAGLFILVYLSLNFIALNPGLPWVSTPYNDIVGGWVSWDSGWYKDIAENGYKYDVTAVDTQFNVVFFPLYPLAIQLFNLFIPKTHLSGLFVANAAFFIGLIALYQTVLQQFNQTVARHTTILLATFPFSFYFSAMYSESLFFFVTVTAFYFAQRKKWFWAALFAALAGAGRAVGITVGFGILLVYLEQNEFKLRQLSKPLLWILLLSPVGFLGYIGFLWLRFGSPLIFMTGRNVTGWEKGRGLHELWPVIQPFLSIDGILRGSFQLLNVLHIAVFAGGLLLLLWHARKLGWSYAVWGALMLILSFVASWHGMGRYALPIFPLFIAMALFLKKESYVIGWSYGQTLLLAMLAIMFSHHYWVS